MKTNGKRILSVLLSLLTVLPPCAALTAVAADTPTVLASGYCGVEDDGTNLTWTITENGVLTISGTGAMADYNHPEWVDPDTGVHHAEYTEETPWAEAVREAIAAQFGFTGENSVDSHFINNDNDAGSFPDAEQLRVYPDMIAQSRYYMRTVIIEEDVVSVGSGAFMGWLADDVRLPSTLQTIGDRAFDGCCFTDITLPEGLVSIGSRAFRQVPLMQITLPSTLQHIEKDAFVDSSLCSVTVNSDVALPGIPCYEGDAPYFTAEQRIAARKLLTFQDLMVCTANEAAALNEIRTAVLLNGLPETSLEDYERMLAVQASIEAQAYAGTTLTGATLSEQNEELIAAVNRLLGSSFTAQQLRIYAANAVVYSTAFITAGAAQTALYENGFYPVLYALNQLESLQATMLYETQMQGIPSDQSAALHADAIREILQRTEDCCGVTAAGLNEAETALFTKFNADCGSSFTPEADVSLIPFYQVDTAALNAAFNEAFGLTDGDASRTPEWEALGDLGELQPALWFTVVSCSYSVLQHAAAAGVNTETADHAFDLIQDHLPATCTEPGKDIYMCVNCGLQFEAPVNALGHTPTAYPETQPTYEAHGYTAGVYCAQCDTWLSGHEVIHNTFGAREVLQQPTTEEEGEVIITCSVCGERGLYAIERLEYTEPEEEPETRPTIIEQVAQTLQKAVNSVVNWILRLVKWLGKK